MMEGHLKLVCSNCASVVYLPPGEVSGGEARCPYCRGGTLAAAPTEKPGRERRIYRRVEVMDGSVVWKASDGLARRDLLSDLSLGGCAFFVRPAGLGPDHPAEGAVHEFLIDIAGNPKVAVQAEVRRVRSAAPPHRYKVALAFLDDGYLKALGLSDLVIE